MQFTCPYCGKGSFKIVNDEAGSPFAICNNCSKTIPFEQQQMTESSVMPADPRAQRQKLN